MGSVFSNPSVMGSAAVAALGGTAYGVSEYAKHKNQRGTGQTGSVQDETPLLSKSTQAHDATRTASALESTSLHRPLQA